MTDKQFRYGYRIDESKLVNGCFQPIDTDTCKATIVLYANDDGDTASPLVLRIEGQILTTEPTGFNFQRSLEGLVGAFAVANLPATGERLYRIIQCQADGQNHVEFTLHKCRLTANTVKAEIERIVDTRTAEFLKDLPKELETILRNAVCSLIGLRSGWNGTFEVDMTNGRRSALTEFMSEIIKQEIPKVIGPIVTEVLTKLKTNQSFISAISKETENTYRTRLLEAVRAAAATQAVADAEALMAAYRNLKTEPLPLNTDLTDPKSYAGEVGAIVLEHLVNTKFGPELKQAEQNAC